MHKCPICGETELCEKRSHPHACLLWDQHVADGSFFKWEDEQRKKRDADEG